MAYTNRMMESDGAPQAEEKKEKSRRCACGAELRYAKELQTVHGNLRNVWYCPNPSAHDGKLYLESAE